MTDAPLHRKIGGIHWLALGRVRVSWCITRPTAPQPRRTARNAALATLAALAACTATTPRYNLVGLTTGGDSYALDTQLTADDCRTSPLGQDGRYNVTYCENAAVSRTPRLYGIGCNGTLLGIATGSEEDEMPRCAHIDTLPFTR